MEMMLRLARQGYRPDVAMLQAWLWDMDYGTNQARIEVAMDQKDINGTMAGNQVRGASYKQIDPVSSVRRRRLIGGLVSAPILTLVAPSAMA